GPAGSRRHGQLFVAVAQVILLVIEALLLLHLGPHGRVRAVATDDALTSDFRDRVRRFVAQLDRGGVQIDAGALLLEEKTDPVMAGPGGPDGAAQPRPP